jgi:hypothetical protein
MTWILSSAKPENLSTKIRRHIIHLISSRQSYFAFIDSHHQAGNHVNVVAFVVETGNSAYRSQWLCSSIDVAISPSRETNEFIFDSNILLSIVALTWWYCLPTTSYSHKVIVSLYGI